MDARFFYEASDAKRVSPVTGGMIANRSHSKREKNKSVDATRVGISAFILEETSYQDDLVGLRSKDQSQRKLPNQRKNIVRNMGGRNYFGNDSLEHEAPPMHATIVPRPAN